MAKNCDLQNARKKADKLGLPRIQRHIVICCDKKSADCASSKQMSQSWKYLRKRLKELKLGKSHGVYPSRSFCLDVCHSGPIAVVHPDGIWYGNCSPEVLEEIIQKHLIGGEVVEDYVIARSQCCPESRTG